MTKSWCPQQQKGKGLAKYKLRSKSKSVEALWATCGGAHTGRASTGHRPRVRAMDRQKEQFGTWERLEVMAVWAWYVFTEGGASRQTVPSECSMLAHNGQLVSDNYHTWPYVPGLQNTMSICTNLNLSSTSSGHGNSIEWDQLLERKATFKD